MPRQKSIRAGQELDRQTALTAEQEAGAHLDALGLSTAAIAEELNIRVGTVSGWKQSARFIARRNEIIGDKIHVTGGVLVEAQKGLFAAASLAIAYLASATQATDSEGLPLHEVRLEASKILVNKLPTTDTLAQLAIAQAKAQADAKDGDVSPARIELTFKVDSAGGIIDVDEIEVEAEE